MKRKMQIAACGRPVIYRAACYDLFTTACCNSVHNSTVAVLSQQDAEGLFPTALLQFCHNSLQQIWLQSVAAMWRQAATCRANASDMRPVDDIPQQADNRPAATCANLAVYMTLCGSLRDERRRVRYTRILIFVIDELSRIRHLIGF